jgi:hypothetical protein
MVVHRHKMRETLARTLKLLTKKASRAVAVRSAFEVGPYAVPTTQGGATQVYDLSNPKQPTV